MTTLEKLKPMPGKENGDVPLETIVGELPPKLEPYRSYLDAARGFRKKWMETGVYPTESQKVLAELRGDIPEKVLREDILGKQLDRICRAYPVHGVTGIKPRVNEEARVHYGEVRLGETVEYAPRVQ